MPLRVYGGVGVVGVVVVVGVVDVDGVQATTAAQRALTLIKRENCEQGISKSFPGGATGVVAM